MHDPLTVAFEIYLGPKKNKKGHYRSPLVTIWHKDPEVKGDDDSCGWSFPKFTDEELNYIDTISKQQYDHLFARTAAFRENKSYASVCIDQDIFGIIYWMWRCFNRRRNNAIWQYGESLTVKELNYVYQLAFNPVDNFQHHACRNQKEFKAMVHLLFRCWKKYHRPWYKHPRWHFKHWKLQIHPLQGLKRRYWDKCAVCGKRGFKGAAHSDWDGKRIWHAECDNSFIDNKPRG